MSGGVITCNDVPLVREIVSLPGRSATSSAAVQETVDDDDDFVYDVYRTDDDQFDFQSLEQVLAIQAFRFTGSFNTASVLMWSQPRVFSDSLLCILISQV